MAGRRRLLNSSEAGEVMARLARVFPHATSELKSLNDYTFLVAVILSAQTTDKAVNLATRDLFEVAQTPEEMISLGEDGLKGYIRHLGLFNSKARHIIEMSKALIENCGGCVPRTREELEALPGVGRKTANVVMNHLFGAPYIAVDTHVKRLSHILGLSENSDLQKIEGDLYKVIPEEWHSRASDLLVLHGRYVCRARRPACSRCVLKGMCKFAKGV